MSGNNYTKVEKTKTSRSRVPVMGEVEGEKCEKSKIDAVRILEHVNLFCA